MSRIPLGLAAVSLAVLTACGTTPGATPTPAPSPSTTSATAATPTATPAATATPTATATPDGTTSPTATPADTASPTATPTAVTITLPERVESFQRVDQRTENEVQTGAYYSDSLKTVVEVRMVRGRPAGELVTSLGGTTPSNVGPALCSTQGDTICAQERGGLTVAVVSKELPATMVANLTTAFGDAAN